MASCGLKNGTAVIRPTRNQVTIVFPNEHQTDNRVRAFQVVQIPARDAGFRFRVGGVAGAELLKIVATSRPEPLFAEQQAVAVGPFRQLDAALTPLPGISASRSTN